MCSFCIVCMKPWKIVLFPPGGIPASPERSSPHLAVSRFPWPSPRLGKSGSLWEQFHFNSKGLDKCFMNRQNGIRTGGGPAPALPDYLYHSSLVTCTCRQVSSLTCLPPIRTKSYLHPHAQTPPPSHVKESVSAYSFHPWLWFSHSGVSDMTSRVSLSSSLHLELLAKGLAWAGVQKKHS